MLLSIKTSIVNFFVNLYHVLPFSGEKKFKIKSYIFTNYGFLCESLPAYTQYREIYCKTDTFNKRKVTLKRKKINILMIYASLPMPDRDAGSINTEYLIKILLDLGFSVSFFPLYFRDFVPKYTNNLKKIGVNVIDNSVADDLTSYLKIQSHNYSFIHLFRYDIGTDCYKSIKKYAPHCKIIFHNMELAYLREKRQAEIEKSIMYRLKALRTKKLELKLIEQADYTVVHTQFEKDKILNEVDSKLEDRIKVFPYIYKCEAGKSFEQRDGIMFIGNYIHPPNYDAALLLLKEILPKIRNILPNTKCYIVGSNPTNELESYADENTIITGFVVDAKEYFKKVKLTVVPLRYSSSVRGKIVISLSHGTPCVTTSMGAEGMGLTNSENIFISDNSDDFVTNVINLYQDVNLWQKISVNGVRFINENYSFNIGKKIISDIINNVSQ